jgi:hypothetical protein
MLGADRLAQRLGSCNKCVHLGMDEAIPSDTTHVILNGHSTRFDEELIVKLEQSVAPILKLLEECRRLKKAIQGIAFVSTAYVQPPLPYRSNEKGRIAFLPFPLESSNCDMNAKQEYDAALRSDAAVNQDFLPYYRNNSCLFSKHILEHLLTEQYHDFPICVVRPSLICPSLDLQDGYKSNFGVPLMFLVANRFSFITPRCEGKLNFVLVEDVINDCMEAVFKLARPASADENGQLWHPIISSTSHSNGPLVAVFKAMAPHVPRMEIRRTWLRNLVRKTEFLVTRLSVGQKGARKYKAVYDSYEYFHANTWDFECRHSERTTQIMIETYHRWLRQQGVTLPCWKRNLMFWIPIQLLMFELIDEKWQIPFL